LAGHAARMGEKRNVYMLFIRKPEGKRQPGRTRRKWVDNIKMDFGEIGWDGVSWILLVQDWDKWRVLVNTLTNFRFP
jgi:hypothetical protein